MCLLLAEIIMILGGLYALIAGRIKLTRNISLEGIHARIAGLILIAPLPLAFLIGGLTGFLIGVGALPPSAQNYIGLIELLLVVGALLGAVIFAMLVKPKETAGSESE
jgi:hypothetical protein